MAPGHLVRSRKMAHWPHSEKCMMRFNKPVIWPSGKCGAFYKGHLELIWEDISGSEHFRTQLNQTWKQQEINMPYTWPIQKWWVESLGLGKIWATYAKLIKILSWLGHCDFIATPVSRQTSARIPLEMHGPYRVLWFAQSTNHFEGTRKDVCSGISTKPQRHPLRPYHEASYVRNLRA